MELSSSAYRLGVLGKGPGFLVCNESESISREEHTVCLMMGTEQAHNQVAVGQKRIQGRISVSTDTAQFKR